MQSTNGTTAWPRLGLDDWAPTQTTLQRWTQIVGKTRLALAPMQNHWWQVVLYVTERGLTTSPIPCDGRTFDVSFDLTNHKLIARTSDGDVRTLPLVAQSVADFYASYMAMLDSLGIEVKIKPVPMEMSDTMRFTDDHTHASYDPEAVHRFWQVLVHADRVLKEFSISRAPDSRAVRLRCIRAEFQTVPTTSWSKATRTNASAPAGGWEPSVDRLPSRRSTRTRTPSRRDTMRHRYGRRVRTIIR